VEIRGAGMMWGIELDRPSAPVAKELLAKGFVVGTAREKVLRLLPPYVTPKKAFVEFVVALEKILELPVARDPLPTSVIAGEAAPWQPATGNRQLRQRGVVQK
jgi:hypothetical protein